MSAEWFFCSPGITLASFEYFIVEFETFALKENEGILCLVEDANNNLNLISIKLDADH